MSTPTPTSVSTSLKLFKYKDEIFLRVVPGKNLFRSSMVHEVVNRGDIFAVRMSDSILTIIPGTAEVEQLSVQGTLL